MSTIPQSLRTDLEAEYLMIGNAKDTSGSGYDGTVNGATLTTDILNRPNRAYAFAGDDTINITPNFSTSKFSVSFYMSYTDSTNLIMAMMLRSSTSQYNAGFQIYLNNEGDLNIYAGGNSGSGQDIKSITNSDLYNGELNHIVIVCDFSTHTTTMYLNGVSQSVSTVRATNSGTTDLDTLSYFAGDYVNERRYLTGTMADIKIWSRLLTAEEVKQLYIRGIGTPI